MQNHQNGAKASGKGAAEHLEAGKCLTLLSEATRKLLGKPLESAKTGARASGKGAAEHLEAG